jgi:hypothetical protein
MLESEALILWEERLILINLMLNSLPMFMMPIFKIMKGVLKKIDLYR